MKAEITQKLYGQFEQIARSGEEVEFWLARDLQPLLGYARWENFVNVVEKAKLACRNSGRPIPDHFRDVTKMVDVGSGAQRAVPDIALTRYACYLVAQNGDPGKDPIAFAQTYFALQTRRHELIEERLQDRERLQARRKLSASERVLSGIIFERLGQNQSFARIRSKGDQALFGGLTTRDMKTRLGVPEQRPLADFLPTITIKAKDFVNEITNFNIKRDDLCTEPEISDEHVKNNAEVRRVLTGRGIKPETLPPADDIQKLKRRERSELKTVSKQVKGLPAAEDKR